MVWYRRGCLRSMFFCGCLTYSCCFEGLLGTGECGREGVVTACSLPLYVRSTRMLQTAVSGGEVNNVAVAFLCVPAVFSVMGVGWWRGGVCNVAFVFGLCSCCWCGGGWGG